MVFSDFRKEVEYVENIMQPYAKMNQVNIQVRLTNTLKTEYDENQIQQCLINLVKNGIEAMQENGGTLHVDVSEHKKNILDKDSRQRDWHDKRRNFAIRKTLLLYKKRRDRPWHANGL